MSKKQDYNNKNLLIPSKILKDRTISSLEAITEFLKEERNLSYHEIGVLINRNERNVWTLYQRAKKKRQHKESTK